MNTNRKNRSRLNHVAILIALVAITFFANRPASAQLPASGNMQFSELIGGPATMTIRQVNINPLATLGWHYHPGIGAYTVVRTGTLVVEDGCGYEDVYQAGEAFIEHPNRVHRGKNLSSDTVITTYQMFLVPVGTGISQPLPERACGAPLGVSECRKGGWQMFNFPRTFNNQGDCEQFVLTGQ